MSLSCEFKFCSAVRGYHVYRDTWKPYVSECLRCEHEIDNLFDMFAIKVCLDNSIVGHLPREISRATKFLLDRGALINVTIRLTIVRRSPLFQGGLEVLCTVEVSMPKTVKSQELMNRYQEMVMDLYHEPDDDVIIGTIDKEIVTDHGPPKKKKKTASKKIEITIKNNNTSIHDFFKKV